MRSGYPQLGHALQSVKTTVEANALAFPWSLCGKAVDAPVLTEEGYCLQCGSLKANSTHSVECLIYLSQIVAYHGLNLRRQGPYKANDSMKPGPKKLKQSGTIPCYKLVSNTVVPKIPTYLIWSELGGSFVHHALPALRTLFRTLQVTVVTESH